MRGSLWYAPQQQQQQQAYYGWDTTSDDYRSHLEKMERTTSISPDVPIYPSLHKAFNNKYAYVEEKESSTTEPGAQLQKKSPEKPQKKVQVSDQRIEIVNTAPQVVCEESIDEKAHGFIQKKRNCFELCKWNTFK